MVKLVDSDWSQNNDEYNNNLLYKRKNNNFFTLKVRHISIQEACAVSHGQKHAWPSLEQNQTLTKSTVKYWWGDRSIGFLIGWPTNPSRGTSQQSGVTLILIITFRYTGRQLRCGTSGGFCVWIIDFFLFSLFFARSPPPGGFSVCTNTEAATLQIRQHKTICMLITVFRDCCVFALLSDRGGGLSPGLQFKIPNHDYSEASGRKKCIII